MTSSSSSSSSMTTPSNRSSTSLPGNTTNGQQQQQQQQHHQLGHSQTANALISLILVVMLGFILFMTVFFWRKYKHITLSVANYQYSQLSQNEGDADLTEVAEQLGLSLGNSSSDDELEPATLTVTTSQYACVNGPRINGTLTTVGTIGTVGTVQVLGSSLLEESDEELLQ